MNNRGLKIPVIILTVLTYLSVTVSFNALINLAHEMSFPVIENLDGVISSILYFFVIGIVAFFALGSILIMSGLNILFCSIDLNKSINYNYNIAFDIVFMSLNFLVYVFIVGIIMYAIC